MNTESSLDTIIQSIEQFKWNNRYDQAKNLALESLKIHTDDYQLYEELADIYLFEWDLKKASEVLAIAREIHPESGTGMYLAGYIATASGKFDEAIRELTIANQNLPNNSEILRNLWWAHVMSGAEAKGILLLRRAHSLAPEDVMIMNDLAVALMTLGQEVEAREILKTIGQEEMFDTLKQIPLSHSDNPSS